MILFNYCVITFGRGVMGWMYVGCGGCCTGGCLPGGSITKIVGVLCGEISEMKVLRSTVPPGTLSGAHSVNVKHGSRKEGKAQISHEPTSDNK